MDEDEAMVGMPGDVLTRRDDGKLVYAPPPPQVEYGWERYGERGTGGWRFVFNDEVIRDAPDRNRPPV